MADIKIEEETNHKGFFKLENQIMVGLQDKRLTKELRSCINSEVLGAKASCSKCYGRGNRGMHTKDIMTKDGLVPKGRVILCQCVKVNLTKLQEIYDKTKQPKPVEVK